MSNNTTELYKEIMRIEDEENLFNIELAGEKIWEFVRYNFIAWLMEEITGVSVTNKSSDKIELNKDFNNYYDDIYERKIFDFEQRDLLIVCHPRRVKDDDIYRCIITDELTSKLDWSYYVLEDAYQGYHMVPRCTQNLKYRDCNAIFSFYKYNEIYSESEIFGVLNKIVDSLEANLSITMSFGLKNKLYISIKDSMKKIYMGRLYSRYVLSKVQPKAVLVAVCYNIWNQTLVAEAKKIGIPTIDIQHGRIGELHPAYNYARKLPLLAFPDYIFVYGKYEKETPTYPIDNRNVFECGYPELERKSKLYAEQNISCENNVVTFLSSPTDGNVIVKYAVSFIKYIKDNNLNYEVIYKLHPSEYIGWESRYPELLKEDVSVISNNEHDIYYFLARSRYVVSITSTALFEAMMFDTNIIILKEQDYEKAKAVYETGCAKLINNQSEFCEYIVSHNSNLRKKKTDFYFAKNSVANMKKAIEFCIKKSNINSFPIINNVDKNYVLTRNANCTAENYLSLFRLMKKWFEIKQEGKQLNTYFVENDIRNIAIYGLGEVGRLLYEDIVHTDIKVSYGIDKNVPYFFDNTRAKRPGEKLDEVDAVIVTAVYYYPEIKRALQHMNSKIISLFDILYSL